MRRNKGEGGQRQENIKREIQTYALEVQSKEKKRKTKMKGQAQI
jgi:hypothetical protein